MTRMYHSLQLPWSEIPSPAEAAYKAAGLVKTKGTVFLLPPDQELLVEAYNALPRPKSRLSAGAVALCKHFERGGASSEHGRPHPYWPLPKGSAAYLHEAAARTLEKMFETIIWRNMMMLHPGVAVHEIRNDLGYGMRWTVKIEQTDSADSSVDREIASGPINMAEPGGLLEIGEYHLTDITFRGFLEPIEGMGLELDC